MCRYSLWNILSDRVPPAYCWITQHHIIQVSSKHCTNAAQLLQFQYRQHYGLSLKKILFDAAVAISFRLIMTQIYILHPT
jgi:hypothetical protein